MKKLTIGLVLMFLSVGFACADNTINVEPDKMFTVYNYDAIALDRARPAYALSEMEKANNALARIMGRTIPHAQPAVLHMEKNVKHGKQLVDVQYHRRH